MIDMKDILDLQIVHQVPLIETKIWRCGGFFFKRRYSVTGKRRTSMDPPCGPGLGAYDFSFTERPASAPVYLVKLLQHTPENESCSVESEDSAHWIVVVDVDRRTDEKHVQGLDLHLLRETPESSTLVFGGPMLAKFEIAKLCGYKFIGDIHNLGGHTSIDWALSLHLFASETFCALAEMTGTSQWSDHMNCQQYARKLLWNLGLPFSEEVSGDTHKALIVCNYTYDGWTRRGNENREARAAVRGQLDGVRCCVE